MRFSVSLIGKRNNLIFFSYLIFNPFKKEKSFKIVQKSRY
jgi:hypothetical protein